MRRVLQFIILLFAMGCLADVASAQILSSEKGFEKLFEDEQPLVSLSDIIESPKNYKGLPILFECRFHKLDDMFTPVYTPFTHNDFINFAVWNTDIQVWQEDISTDFPFLYIRKGVMERAVVMVKQMQRIRKYEKLTLAGRVVSVFDGRPYIEVSSILRSEEDEPISEKALLFMHLAEIETDGKSYTEAAKLYLRAIDAGICREFEGICYRRAGELNFKMRNYEHALELLKLAQKRIPDDAGLEDIMAIVKHVIYYEESGDVSEDVAEANAREENQVLGEQVSDLSREVTRLREEITALSNQKIELLQSNDDLQQMMDELKTHLLSQEEMEVLREELRQLKAEREEQQGD